MSERRFNDAEVAEIFQRATEAQQSGKRLVPLSEGMTLSDLQDIGRQVGISPELIADAAKSIDRVGRATTRRLLGLPIGVGRTVDLDRKLTQEDWERLVVDLRETFDARGRLREEGSFRQWTNGNLQVLLEPTDRGHRLRLRTLKGAAVGWIGGGLAVLGGAVAVFIAMAVNGTIADPGALSSLGFLGAMGLGMLSVAAIQLPGWARTRRRQMEEVAARLTIGPTSEASS
jgi:hypothetical protein